MHSLPFGKWLHNSLKSLVLESLSSKWNLKEKATFQALKVAPGGTFLSTGESRYVPRERYTFFSTTKRGWPFSLPISWWLRGSRDSQLLTWLDSLLTHSPPRSHLLRPLYLLPSTTRKSPPSSTLARGDTGWTPGPRDFITRIIKRTACFAW